MSKIVKTIYINKIKTFLERMELKMSYADKVFKETCIDILENGTDTSGEEVRPHWEDGTPAYTIKQFGIVNRYDLRKEFPAITLRRIALKSAMDEILWIYQRKSNNIKDLNSHIWDEWADETGSIGTCYGYTIGEHFIYKNKPIDQIDYVRKQLKENPPISEDMIKTLMRGMGRNPSQKQVNQLMKQMQRYQ
jgi:thymidylate synthase